MRCPFLSARIGGYWWVANRCGAHFSPTRLKGGIRATLLVQEDGGIRALFHEVGIQCDAFSALSADSCVRTLSGLVKDSSALHNPTGDKKERTFLGAERVVCTISSSCLDLEL